MRNPFARLVHRAPAKPSLRERLATLKGSAARVIRRKPLGEAADPVRRSTMKGTLAAATAIPFVGFSGSAMASTGPHPDQALLDAEAEYLRLKAEDEAMSKASSEAWLAKREAIGLCPDALFIEDWEDRAFNSFWRGSIIRRLPLRTVHHEVTINPDFAWTAEALRQAIALAPEAFGRAGRTPFHIRRWRGLLPLAEAHDARCEAADKRFRSSELSSASTAAQKAACRADARLTKMPATTIEGLAVHARRLSSTPWYDTHSGWAVLLQGVAVVAGVTLRQSEFDVAAWLKAWEGLGGKVEWWSNSNEWAFISPPTKGVPAERKEEVDRISAERNMNSAVIYRWLEARR